MLFILFNLNTEDRKVLNNLTLSESSYIKPYLRASYLILSMIKSDVLWITRHVGQRTHNVKLFLSISETFKPNNVSTFKHGTFFYLWKLNHWFLAMKWILVNVRSWSTVRAISTTVISTKIDGLACEVLSGQVYIIYRSRIFMKHLVHYTTDRPITFVIGPPMISSLKIANMYKDNLRSLGYLLFCLCVCLFVKIMIIRKKAG